MHLHLGGQNSDELLFLVQYPERVVLLEINSHKHFATEPKGSLLDSLHERHLARIATEIAMDAASEAARRGARLAGAMHRLKSTIRKPKP